MIWLNLLFVWGFVLLDFIVEMSLSSQIYYQSNAITLVSKVLLTDRNYGQTLQK